MQSGDKHPQKLDTFKRQWNLKLTTIYKLENWFWCVQNESDLFFFFLVCLCVCPCAHFTSYQIMFDTFLFHLHHSRCFKLTSVFLVSMSCLVCCLLCTVLSCLTVVSSAVCSNASIFIQLICCPVFCYLIMNYHLSNLLFCTPINKHLSSCSYQNYLFQ